MVDCAPFEFGCVDRLVQDEHRRGGGAVSRGIERTPNTSMSLRVLFALPQDVISPGSRYRVFQYLAHFEAAGLTCATILMQGRRSTERSLRSAQLGSCRRLLHYGAVWWDRHVLAANLLKMLRHFDRIYIYRIGMPEWALPALRRHRDWIIFDFDDALDQAEVGSDGIAVPLRARVLRRGLRNSIGIAAITVTTNQRNADFVRGVGGQPVIVPTSVDISRYRYRERRRPLEDHLVLGWIGTPSTAHYLRLVEAALHRISRSGQVKLRLIGAGANPFASVDAEVRDWRLELECEEIRAFDVGLMPMPDSPWTRGKAALKALQYGASGAPSVASWTPTNVELLGDGEGTLFCRSEEEWVEALERLLRNPELRVELGARAFRKVAAQFSVDVNAPKLIELIRSAPACPREVVKR